MVTLDKSPMHTRPVYPGQSLHKSIKDRAAQRVSSQEPSAVDYSALIPQAIKSSPIVIGAAHEPFFRRLNNIYFKPKPFEKDGKIYEDLGVKYVKKVVMGTIGRAVKIAGADKKPSNYFIGKKHDLAALEKFEKVTRINEFIHAPLIPLFGYQTVNALAEGKYGEAVLNGTMLLVQVSCVMLQRYNRVKITDVIDRKKKRAQTA